MLFDTVWSICVFSITVILINSNSAVDVKITWTVELLVIRITGNVALESFFCSGSETSLPSLGQRDSKLAKSRILV